MARSRCRSASTAASWFASSASRSGLVALVGMYFLRWLARCRSSVTLPLIPGRRASAAMSAGATGVGGDTDLKARASHQLPPTSLVRFVPVVRERPPGRPVLDPCRRRGQRRQPIARSSSRVIMAANRPGNRVPATASRQEPSQEPTLTIFGRHLPTLGDHLGCSSAHWASLGNVRRRPKGDWGSKGRRFTTGRFEGPHTGGSSLRLWARWGDAWSAPLPLRVGSCGVLAPFLRPAVAERRPLQFCLDTEPSASDLPTNLT
jgi:hypothetical protein